MEKEIQEINNRLDSIYESIRVTIRYFDFGYIGDSNLNIVNALNDIKQIRILLKKIEEDIDQRK